MNPSDIMLAPGESGLYGRTFRPNLVLFWLRTTILVTNRRIVVKGANSMLGIIPLGYEERAMPIRSISGVNSSLAVAPFRLLTFGMLSLLMVILMFRAVGDGSPQMILWLLLALLFGALAANAVTGKFTVTNSGGGTSDTTVSAFEMAALESFKNRANEIIYSTGEGGTSWNQAMADGFDGSPHASPLQYSAPRGYEPTRPGSDAPSTRDRYDAPRHDGPGYEGPRYDGPGQHGPRYDGPGYDGPGRGGPRYDGPGREAPRYDDPGRAPGYAPHPDGPRREGEGSARYGFAWVADPTERR